MPSLQSPLGALPSRFRRERVLIVGCGDVGMRIAKQLRGRIVMRALSSTPARFADLRAAGITPLAGNLDNPATLRRLAGISTRVFHLAPPAAEHSGAWWRDLRTLSLLRTLSTRSPPSSVVYASTSGVYGDCEGALVDETWTPRPRTPRAQRRVDAERLVRHFGRRTGSRTAILRVPGIYGPGRRGGPKERLLSRTPVLREGDDVYTNHIHADDLARIANAAMWRGSPQRIYNASDNTHLKVGDFYDLAADLYGLERPPRVPRADAEQQLSLGSLSFLGESRRLSNARVVHELRVHLKYPSVADGLRAT